MKLLIFSMLLALSYFSSAQDVIVMKTGKEIDCRITKIEAGTIYYSFNRGDREITSFVSKADIRSYRIGVESDAYESASDSLKQTVGEEVLVDTTEYVKHSYRWNSILSCSPRFGIRGSGWNFQYYGYVNPDDSDWIIPYGFGIEFFSLNSDLLTQLDYAAWTINYGKIGLSPFKKLSDKVLLKFDLHLLLGEEQLLRRSGYLTEQSIFGGSFAQAIYFISDPKFGIVFSVGIYEKLLTADLYKSDLGVNIEFGIKF